MDSKNRESTQIIHAGRNPKEQGWMVNPPIYQSSTIVFPTLQDLLDVEKGYENPDLTHPYELKYGRYGTQTNFALERAIAEMENGYSSLITSSGMSAIYVALNSFLKQGDHLLMVDNAYSPTRDFVDVFLKKYGVSATYYDPRIGCDIEKLVQKNTKVIFMESPGSLSFEVQDVDAICQVAKKHDIITILDNSWGSALYFKPLNHGVDVSIMALTKYINGHSDIMMGSVTIKDRKHFALVKDGFKFMAATAAPFSAYMVQRGLRTLKIRMEACYKNALALAKWLEQRPEVYKVLYPALESSEDHVLWKKYFSGAAGIFTIILNKKYPTKALANMLDNLHYYGMGYSWGGYESLILPVDLENIRTVKKWPFADKTCLRINVGLEDVEDLKTDLAQGFERLEL